MTNPSIADPTPTPTPDPYSITPEAGGIFVLHFNGLYVDEGYSYGDMETAKLLHAALQEAEDCAEGDQHRRRCGEDYGTYLGAAGAAHQAERDGRWLVPVGCPRCGGWHLREGR